MFLLLRSFFLQTFLTQKNHITNFVHYISQEKFLRNTYVSKQCQGCVRKKMLEEINYDQKTGQSENDFKVAMYILNKRITIES